MINSEYQSECVEKIRSCGINVPEKSVYFDYAGAGVASRHQLEQVFAEIISHPMGNPHSGGILGASTDRIVQEARNMVLQFFGTTSESYDCIFTSGTTASLKLIGESFGWSHPCTSSSNSGEGDGSYLCYPMNSHTSVLGLRELAPNSICVGSHVVREKMKCSRLQQQLCSSRSNGENCTIDPPVDASNHPSTKHLLVVPGECNFSGARVSVQEIGKFVQQFNDDGSSLLDWLHSTGGATPVRMASRMWGADAKGVDGSNSLGQRKETTTRATAAEQWYWLLDAAKLASSAPMQLDNWFGHGGTAQSSAAPHFVVASFYKVFGYPTGVGVLLVRRDCRAMMMSKKRYFGGGTVATVVANRDFTVLRSNLPAVDSGATAGSGVRADDGNKLSSQGAIASSPSSSSSSWQSLPLHHSFEDGTVNYHGIAALRHGFRALEALGGMGAIARYTRTVTEYLLAKMRQLRHGQSRIGGAGGGVDKQQGGGKSAIPLCMVYGRDGGSNIDANGPVITFNLQDCNGDMIGYHAVGKLATANKFSKFLLRTGCFCNVGACQELMNITADEAISNYQSGRTCWVADDEESDGDNESASTVHAITDVINGKPTGAVRVSLGMYSTTEECDLFVQFLEAYFLDQCFYSSKSSTTTATGATTTTDANYSNSTKKADAEPLHLPLDSSDIPKLSSNSSNKPRLRQMFVYPIKSCAGIEVQRCWPVTPGGLLFDRQWAIVHNNSKEQINQGGYGSNEGRNHRALTQKAYPKMSLIAPTIEENLWTAAARGDATAQSEYVMRISAPGMPTTLAIPLYDDDEWDEGGDRSERNAKVQGSDNGGTMRLSEQGMKQVDVSSSMTQIRVCGRKCFGRIYDGSVVGGNSQQSSVAQRVSTATEVNSWFTAYLGVECALVRNASLPTGGSSGSEKATTGRSDGSDSSSHSASSYANDASFLLISAESVEALREMILCASGDRIANDKEKTGTAAVDLSAASVPIPPELTSGTPEISVRNFRPNLVVIGSTEALSKPHQEDSWKSVQMPIHLPPSEGKNGSPSRISLNVTGPCSRCSMVNINPKLGVLTTGGMGYLPQHTGSSHNSPAHVVTTPLAALSAYRKVGNSIYFGQFCEVAAADRDKLQQIAPSVLLSNGADACASMQLEPETKWPRAYPLVYVGCYLDVEHKTADVPSH